MHVLWANRSSIGTYLWIYTYSSGEKTFIGERTAENLLASVYMSSWLQDKIIWYGDIIPHVGRFIACYTSTLHP